ncbi:hypothetical protein tb265_34230 [Gemmatimonadetes bacterium T265]|nr:hypothetical protein tb265_34230 [Gemmatimonadetes bacterium T265]
MAAWAVSWLSVSRSAASAALYFGVGAGAAGAVANTGERGAAAGPVGPSDEQATIEAATGARTAATAAATLRPRDELCVLLRCVDICVFGVK